MLLTTGKCVGGEEPFYASMSIVIPDLNSTVKWSAKTVDTVKSYAQIRLQSLAE